MERGDRVTAARGGASPNGRNGRRGGRAFGGLCPLGTNDHTGGEDASSRVRYKVYKSIK